MDAMRKLPDAEFDIMKAVWQLAPPVTAGQLLEVLAEHGGKSWKPQTLHTLLVRLSERGFLESEKKGKERTYRALVPREAYLQFETRSFMQQYHEGSLMNLVNTALHADGLSEADIDELAQWVRKRSAQQ